MKVKRMKYDLEMAHSFSNNHKPELEKDKKCGCFYCLTIFAPSITVIRSLLPVWLPLSQMPPFRSEDNSCMKNSVPEVPELTHKVVGGQS